jgi:hypothetical protein
MHYEILCIFIHVAYFLYSEALSRHVCTFIPLSFYLGTYIFRTEKQQATPPKGIYILGFVVPRPHGVENTCFIT